MPLSPSKFRFSLKTMLLAVTFFVVALGYSAWRARQCEDEVALERRVLSQINHNEIVEDDVVPLSVYPIYRFCDPTDFVRVVHLNVSYLSLSANDVPKLKAFSQLRVLDVSNNNIGDSGFIMCCNQYPTLTDLYAEEANLSDNALSDLSRLRYLRVLDISMNSITDDGVNAIANQPLLELCIDYNPISDKALEHLKRNLRLRLLDASGTNVTFVGVTNFCTNHSSIKQLWLNRTGISATEIEQLRKQFPAIEFEGESD